MYDDDDDGGDDPTKLQNHTRISVVANEQQMHKVSRKKTFH